MNRVLRVFIILACLMFCSIGLLGCGSQGNSSQNTTTSTESISTEHVDELSVVDVQVKNTYDDDGVLRFKLRNETKEPLVFGGFSLMLLDDNGDILDKRMSYNINNSGVGTELNPGQSISTDLFIYDLNEVASVVVEEYGIGEVSNQIRGSLSEPYVFTID